ncbi:hypothetical protein SUGI_0806490 [Cryptomeria japonica]|nr:hypothetical protein SUGI_0806490 [Cryptomeria japonica]
MFCSLSPFNVLFGGLVAYSVHAGFSVHLIFRAEEETEQKKRQRESNQGQFLLPDFLAHDAIKSVFALLLFFSRGQ